MQTIWSIKSWLGMICVDLNCQSASVLAWLVFVWEALHIVYFRFLCGGLKTQMVRSKNWMPTIEISFLMYDDSKISIIPSQNYPTAITKWGSIFCHPSGCSLRRAPTFYCVPAYLLKVPLFYPEIAIVIEFDSEFLESYIHTKDAKRLGENVKSRV